MTDHADALQRLDAHYQAMPPVAAMQLRVVDYDGTRLRLAAPLAAHVNDKGCAFGGSLGSLLTLAAWGVLHLRLEDAGVDADIFVADSTLRFLAPLYDDLQATAQLAAATDWDGFLATLRNRGRGRIELLAQVPLPGGGIATEFRARYVAIARR
jgi:thioesterase domain-containing protein